MIVTNCVLIACADSSCRCCL